MSIAGLHIGTKAVQANMIALETAGQNISNVNNPNYTRQRTKLATDITIPKTWGQFGTGVKVQLLEQVKDAFIDREIRDQSSDAKKDEAVFGAYERLLSMYEEGPGYGLNERLGDFFNAFHDLAAYPEDTGMRAAVLGQADLLATQVNFLNGELDQMRLDLDVELRTSIDEVNNLLSQIAGYNNDIVKLEAGVETVAADARDNRTAALRELAEYIDINVTEMDSGSVNVSTNGRILVYSGEYNQLGTKLKDDDELVLYDVVMDGSSDTINFQGGKIAGILEARDTVATEYRDNLDTLAQSLIQELNKIHADGRGLTGYSSLDSTNAVGDNTAVLNSNAAGLDLTPSNGSFQMILTDSSGNEQTFTVNVDPSVDTLEDLATNITAESPRITATANSDGTMTINMSSGYTLQFANDGANILAALGINGLFTGSDASDIAVNSDLSTTPALLAAAQSSSPGDNRNALAMAQIRDSLLLNSNTETFEEFYQSEVTRLGSESKAIDIQAQSSASFLNQLQLRRESVSGVNLDEEAADLIKYQHSLQAAARFVNVMSEMLNTLVNGLV